jgi:N-acetyl-anhydromuramyl-L-alanine amidase AmpD
MLLKLGDFSKDVVECQKLLSLLGYDLVIDGHYGTKTKRSVNAFQKKVGIPVTGMIDQDTYEALKISQTRRPSRRVSTSVNTSVSTTSTPIQYPFPIITNHRLNNNQFIKEHTKKTQLFLHFTASGPNARGVINFWNSNEPQIATPYVIDGAGEIFECYNPDFWSYHLGIKGTRGKLDKTSIGIEICSYGPLKKKGDKFYAWPEDYSKVVVPYENVYSLDRDFRGFKFFEGFNESQIRSLESLLETLIKHYEIDIQSSIDYNWFDFNEDVINHAIPGIWSHSTVRKDKFDIYPDDRVLEMLNRLSQKFAKP